jgi:hypothetical protein
MVTRPMVSTSINTQPISLDRFIINYFTPQSGC